MKILKKTEMSCSGHYTSVRKMPLQQQMSIAIMERLDN
jgi:hypothetical protein